MLEPINQRIIDLMEVLNLTQSDMSRRLELNRSTLNGIIKGRQKPSFKVIQTILRTFPIRAEWLIMGEGNVLKSEDEEQLTLDEKDRMLMEFMDKRIKELEREIKELDPDAAKKLGIK